MCENIPEVRARGFSGAWRIAASERVPGLAVRLVDNWSGGQHLPAGQVFRKREFRTARSGSTSSRTPDADVQPRDVEAMIAALRDGEGSLPGVAAATLTVATPSSGRARDGSTTRSGCFAAGAREGCRAAVF